MYLFIFCFNESSTKNIYYFKYFYILLLNNFLAEQVCEASQETSGCDDVGITLGDE